MDGSGHCRSTDCEYSNDPTCAAAIRGTKFCGSLEPISHSEKISTAVGWGPGGALACSTPPKGYHRWSLRLLAEKMVRLEYAHELSHETVRQVLAENELKPWLRKEWCIPPKENAQFVYHMEDVLDVYQRPANPYFPLICFDETPVQLVSATRTALPMKAGQPERWDYEFIAKERPICLCSLLHCKTGGM